MKRVMGICLAALLLACVTACGGNAGNAAQTNDAAATAAETEEVSQNTEPAKAAESTETTEPAQNADEEGSSDTTGAEQGSSADMESLAGEYTFYGTYLSGEYVMVEALEGTSTKLNADGTGYLNWGENNKGDISEWAVEANNIVIKAGTSTIPGMIGNGVLMLQIGDEEMSFLECYVREDADTSSMPRISAEEWAKKISDSIE